MRNPFLVTVMIISLIVLYIACKQTKSEEKFDSKAMTGSALVSNFARPLTDVKFEATAARLERGKYLANGILSCFHCHSPVDSSKPGLPEIRDSLGAGRLYYGKDSIYIYAPNITPDKETGAGNWTDDMFARAMRSGIGHDGRALVVMPWWIFASLADEDLASVVVYLRSIPAIKNKLPGRQLKPDMEKGVQQETRPITNESVPFPDTSSTLNRGKYLVTIGECEGCHTAWYVRNPGVFGGGNEIVYAGTDSVIVSPNISSDVTGVGGWDDETFTRVMRTGKGGILHPRMPWTSFAHISDNDFSAILAALKSLPPVKHQIVNRLKATLCEVCGVKHGYGDQNKIVPLVGVKVNTSTYPSYVGTYTDKYNDTVHVLLKEKKLWLRMGAHEEVKEIELIPIAENLFHGSGLGSPITFNKDASGKVVSYTDHDIVPLTFAKIEAVHK